jgi:hypothetical protein
MTVREGIVNTKTQAKNLADKWRKEGYIVKLKPLRLESNDQVIHYYVKGVKK